MKRILFFTSLLVVHVGLSEPAASEDEYLAVLSRQFQNYSGAELVFHREALPEGRYHDVLKPLANSKRVEAARICIEQVRMYPPLFLADVGLKKIGVFAACVSKSTSDRTRPYDEQLGGYRYFGVYNGIDAIAAAFYTDGQLELTFHHEVFHHIDSTVDGETEGWQLSGDDAFYRAAISGQRPYPPPAISVEDLEMLRDRRYGITLEDAVSQYAAKNAREDQAETARHVMSMLPDALLQIVEQPELAGSQRIIHVLGEYERALADGPGVDWFVDVALQRAQHDVAFESLDELLARLRGYAAGGATGFAGIGQDPAGARAALKAIARLKSEELKAPQAEEFVQLASRITEALLRARIRPDQTQRQFEIWGREDSAGVNWTLRRDVIRFGSDARRLQLIAARQQPLSDSMAEAIQRTCKTNQELVGNYLQFIGSNWSVTSGTRAVFQSTQQTLAELP